ncbi:hypothetical protein HK101_005609 [Irineochytrium annulatum]|nr:hypothetical protein HK101_005609 [Irineochytrium annulatum]
MTLSKLLEFVDKSKRGLLGFEQANLRVQTATTKVDLSPRLEFGVNIMLLNLSTKGFLAVDVPDNYPAAVFDTDVFPLATTRETAFPCARTCFRLEPLEIYRVEGDVTPRYAQKFYLVASDALAEKPMYLGSEFKSFVSYAKRSKNQQAFLSFHKDKRSIWQFVYEEPKLRLESEGTPVEDNRNNFGVECEVDCHTHRDFGTRRELAHNHWVVKTSE